MLITNKILIVDDERRLCQSLATLLRGHGSHVQEAYSAGEATHLLKKNLFDLALVDLFLPDISGLELMEQIQKKIPGISIIIMTGNASIETAIEALRNGAYDYLRKPFETAELIQTVKNALEKKQLSCENKIIHRQLEVSRRDYQFLVENSPDIIYMLDAEDRFTFVNPSIQALTGLLPAQVIGRHYSAILPEKNRQNNHWILNERRTGERAKQWKELILSTFDTKGIPQKQILYTELQSTGIYQANTASPPAYLGTHGVIRDVTQKKRLAQKKRKIKTRLQRAEKLEMVGTLASGVAHDLNNLLSSILAYPELILLEMSKDDPHRDYIRKIKKSGEDAAVIVNDLLTLARRRVPANQIFDIDEIISDVLTSPEYSNLKTHHPDIRFNINLNACALNMKGSPVHLSKAIINLLNNAAEAMPNGGVITIATDTCCIENTENTPLHLNPGNYVKLVVADTGIGIDPKDVDKIFDPFYTQKKMGRSGTGLGMTVVWATTKDHHGHIDVQSKLGKGTRISLYFPVTSKEKNARPKMDIERLKGKGQTILIVDDILEQRAMASTMLKAIGYKPISVATGEECIRYMKTAPVDLILLDMVLGTKKDGLDVFRQIRQICPQQRVIIVSGQAQTDRTKKALEMGVSLFIKKPYSLETLGLAIQRELPDVTEPGNIKDRSV